MLQESVDMEPGEDANTRTGETLTKGFVKLTELFTNRLVDSFGEQSITK